MKTNLFVLIFLLTTACSEKDSSTHSAPLFPNSEVKEEISFISIQQTMIKKGIHFTRLSQLQDIKRPIAIYCSNTTSLNHEKIEALASLIQSLLASPEEEFLIDKVLIDKSVLITLIEKAASELQPEPYSNTCPKIYLAIQSV